MYAFKTNSTVDCANLSERTHEQLRMKPNTVKHCALCKPLEVINPHEHCFYCPTADSKAIVDGNLKLILGLIWTLILHYSISMPMWDDEDDEETKKLTPKQRLLGWIQNKVPQLPINNFNRDWRDGKALGALVDNCAPGKKCVVQMLSQKTCRDC